MPSSLPKAHVQPSHSATPIARGGVLVVIPRPEHLRTRTRRRSFGPLALTQPFPLSQRQNDEAPTLQLSYEVANSLGLVRALPCINICDRVSPELPKLHPPVAAPHRSAVLLCSDSCYPVEPSTWIQANAFPALPGAASPRLFAPSQT
ncbi:hypothetical protein PaG_00095 [Moesziomyces aphidis]|uniref:Uncharacterized protein n=1 Tax=Moesziomyces aphidis TaxID=84754 RepID=W3VX13_MOEAP|nr:hypothetical protein PaG_00095 [Moesziomyces aphidis]